MTLSGLGGGGAGLSLSFFLDLLEGLLEGGCLEAAGGYRGD